MSTSSLGRRPLPTSLQASTPLSEGMTVKPYRSSVARLSCVMGFSSIPVFMARADQLRAPGRKHHGGKHIIRNAVGHFGNDIGRGGCHQNDVCLFGQRDVGDLELEIPVEGIHHAFVTGQRLKDERGDEMGGVLGHNDLHVGPQLFECTGHICHFIGGNAAGDAQKDALAVQIHGSFTSRKNSSFPHILP